jgi:hypothetical protein
MHALFCPEWEAKFRRSNEIALCRWQVQGFSVIEDLVQAASASHVIPRGSLRRRSECVID